MNNIKVKCSMTVEASLVMPVVLFVIIELIYLGFYLYDCTAVNAVVLKNSYSYNNLENIESEIVSELEDTLIQAKINKCRVSVKKEEVKIDFSGSFVFPFCTFEAKINYRKSLKILNPVEFIRGARNIISLSEGGN